LGEEQTFEVKALRTGALTGATYQEMETYREEVEAAQRDLRMTTSSLAEVQRQMGAMKQAFYRMDREDPQLLVRLIELEDQARKLRVDLYGYSTKSEIGEKDKPTPRERLSVAARGLSTTYGPTELHRESLSLGKAQLDPIMQKVKELTEESLPAMRQDLIQAGAPWMEGQGWPD
jgi:hypothetical protein